MMRELCYCKFNLIAACRRLAVDISVHIMFLNETCQFCQGCASSLYVASNNGHIKTVKQLLTVVDKEMLAYKSPETGRSCIQAAQYNGHKLIAKLLQQAHAKYVEGRAENQQISRRRSCPSGTASSSQRVFSSQSSFGLAIDTAQRFKLGRGISLDSVQKSKKDVKILSPRQYLQKVQKSRTKERTREVNNTSAALAGPNRVRHIVLLITIALKAALRNSEDNHGHGTKWFKTILPQIEKLKTEHPEYTIQANTSILYHALHQTPQENRLSGEIWANKQGTQKWTGKSKTELLQAVVTELE